MDREKLVKEIKKFKEKMNKKRRIEKMILFGSRAREDFREDSDVDLIVVGDFKGKNNLKRAPIFYLEWDINLPVDFLCYTTEEFAKLKKKITLVREAVRNGIVIK